jgi:CheY-like chemotaxis protein
MLCIAILASGADLMRELCPEWPGAEIRYAPKGFPLFRAPVLARLETAIGDCPYRARLSAIIPPDCASRQGIPLICIKLPVLKSVLHAAISTRDFMHSSAPLRVAVIAQDEAVRDSLVLLLNAAGCATMPFRSGAAFLSSPTARRADCLVLDEEIREMSAWDMLHWLRASGLAMKVVLFTGRTSPALVQRAAEAGVAQVLQAPLIAAGLVDFLARNQVGDLREMGG